MAPDFKRSKADVLVRSLYGFLILSGTGFDHLILFRASDFDIRIFVYMGGIITAGLSGSGFFTCE
jgi:hypothetical protein